MGKQKRFDVRKVTVCRQAGSNGGREVEDFSTHGTSRAGKLQTAFTALRTFSQHGLSKLCCLDPCSSLGCFHAFCLRRTASQSFCPDGQSVLLAKELLSYGTKPTDGQIC